MIKRPDRRNANHMYFRDTTEIFQFQENYYFESLEESVSDAHMMCGKA